jgi:hypothetical protein
MLSLHQAGVEARFWRLAIGVRLLQALVAAGAWTLGLLGETRPATLEKPEVVFSTPIVRRADDLPGLPIDYLLRLERMPFLLAAVAAPLFF